MYDILNTNLLIDNYKTTAKLAFSFRKLSKKYKSACIRVRRSSDNQEKDIAFINRNIDSSDLLAFVGANSGYIVTWYDQSGFGNNATQSVSGQQPMIVNTGTLCVDSNNKPCAIFDGSDDNLIVTDPTSLNNATFSINMIYKVLTYVDYERIIQRGNASGYGFSLRQYASGKIMFNYKQYSVDAHSYANSSFGNTYNVVTGIADGSSVKLYKGTTLQTDTFTDAVGDSGGSNVSIGCRAGTTSSATNMEVQEIIAFNKLVDDDLLRTVAKQKRYYNIT